MTNIVKKVASAKVFNRRLTEPVGDWLTPSNEAYAIVAYINFHQQIVDQFEKKTSIAKAPFTEEGKGANKGQGWSQKGLQTFKEARMNVIQDRKDPELSKVDQWFFDEEKAKVNSKQRKRDAMISAREDGWETVEDDLADLVRDLDGKRRRNIQETGAEEGLEEGAAQTETAAEHDGEVVGELQNESDCNEGGGDDEGDGDDKAAESPQLRLPGRGPEEET